MIPPDLVRKHVTDAANTTHGRDYMIHEKAIASLVEQGYTPEEAEAGYNAEMSRFFRTRFVGGICLFGGIFAWAMLIMLCLFAYHVSHGLQFGPRYHEYVTWIDVFTHNPWFTVFAIAGSAICPIIAVKKLGA